MLHWPACQPLEDGSWGNARLPQLERASAPSWSERPPRPACTSPPSLGSGSPCIRTNIPPAKGMQPDLERAADSLLRVAEHASTKNVVVSLENDNPVSEDPFFLVKLIEKVNSPWLRALPDFCNTLAAKDAD